MSTVQPHINDRVLYRTDGRNGLVYDLAAVITVTRDSHPGDYPDGRRNPLPVPSSETHVHLTVFTPGGFGTDVVRDGDDIIEGPDDEDFVGATTLVPGSGTYVEWDVPHAAWRLGVGFEKSLQLGLDPGQPPPRSWRYALDPDTWGGS